MSIWIICLLYSKNSLLFELPFDLFRKRGWQNFKHFEKKFVQCVFETSFPRILDFSTCATLLCFKSIFFNKTREVTYCSEAFQFHDSAISDGTSPIYIVGISLVVGFVIFLVCSLFWLLLVDRVLSALKIASVPSISSICSQQSLEDPNEDDPNQAALTFEPGHLNSAGSFVPYLETTSEESWDRVNDDD